MPKLAFLTLFCFLGSLAVGQDYVGDKREKVRKKFEKYLQHLGASDRITETDSSLVLSIRDPKFKPVDFTLLFDSENKCIAEIRTGCDTCVANYLQYALEKKFHQWQQTGNNQFLSNSRFKLSMELLPGEKGSMLVIKKLALNRRDYLKLLKQRKN
jgi:hypothetical protein